MKRDDAKDAILRDWMALEPDERATLAHARLFAISKAGEYRFRSKEDRSDLIEAWLREHVSKGRGGRK